jgi:hypothetical protein
VWIAGVSGGVALGEGGFEREQQQLALVGEVVGERARGPARLGRHLADRRCAHASPRDELGGAGELGPPFVDVDDLRH